jgi:predicted kinase
METIIFCGIQATGKSSFYKERFFNTHLHLSLDLLNTRNRLGRFMETCFTTQLPFVIDNTNPTREEREQYIRAAKAHHYKVIGYYFKSVIGDSLLRNSKRQGKELIPEKGVKGTYNKLQLPMLEEGYDELYYVELSGDGFMVKPWATETPKK